MGALDDILKDAQRARLIPVVADSKKEERIVSILLATLRVVGPFAEQFLDQFGVRVGKTSDLYTHTEVNFEASDGSGPDRPDGVLSLVGRRSKWTALLEAKIDNFEISENQVQRYADIARSYEIDAVITLSNQLAPSPTHVPYSLPKRRSKRVEFFHVSWRSILTQALLILRDKEQWIKCKKMTHEQAFILEEMTRYFRHPSTGIRGFVQMNPEWGSLVRGVRNQQQFKRSSFEIENTVGAWHQEERDLCLILSRRIGKRVEIRIAPRHRANAGKRLQDACNSLIESQELRCCFGIPNAVSDVEVTASLQRRMVSCSMKLNAPGDRKRSSARVNWLVRQLRDVESDDVDVRAFWPRGGGRTQESLSRVRTDPKCLDINRPGAAPTSFEVIMNRELAGRFSGRRTFIEDLEKLVPDFYDQIGQKLRRWVQPPPSIDKQDSIETPDNVESTNEPNQDDISQSEADRPQITQ